MFEEQRLAWTLFLAKYCQVQNWDPQGWTGHIPVQQILVSLITNGRMVLISLAPGEGAIDICGILFPRWLELNGKRFSFNEIALAITVYKMVNFLVRLYLISTLRFRGPSAEKSKGFSQRCPFKPSNSATA